MEIPLIGFGTFRLKGDDAYNMVLSALQNGYRHIDTAKLYGNEKNVGKAIKDSGINRNEIFITTKIWKDDLKNENRMIKSVKNSLKKLDVDYIDLVLLHTYPVEIGGSDLSELVTTWKVMEDIIDNKIIGLENKVRYIGVSNYKVIHLEQLLNCCKYKPYVNQIEITPFLIREDLSEYCQKNDIKVVAHTSLIKGEKFTDNKLITLSEKYKMSMSLLLLSWAVTKNYIVLPRTSNLTHLIDNYKCMKVILSDEIINELDNLNENYATHPQYINE